MSDLGEDKLEDITLITNRAPLVLAFAASLLKYTMPEQPPSSRLSLAQAVTSMNAKAKAANIGLDKDKPAENEGWGQGQPLVKVMGRDIHVLKRWGYDWKPNIAQPQNEIKTEDLEQKQTIQQLDETAVSQDTPALWALDLEKLKHLNKPPILSSPSSTTGLPIYTPDSAHSYTLRAFDPASPPGSNTKKTASEVRAEREANLGHLIKALDLLFQSWSPVLDVSELDKRAWNWYVRVRPEVESGRAGWGAKGQVRLQDILDLRRRE